MTRPTRTALLAVATLLLSLAGPPAGADDYPRNPDVDILHYGFELTLSDDSDVVAGRACITAAFTADGVTELGLDLVGADGPTGMEVTAVTGDGDAVAFEHADDRLVLRLATPSRAGERRTFAIEYRGVPGDGLIIGTNRHGDRTFFGDNWPNRARHWLPTVDHVSDKATVEWTVVAPSHYQVVGSGRLVEETDLEGGLRRTRWSTAVPIPTKVMVIGAARFAVEHLGEIEDVPLQSWVYPEDLEGGFREYAAAERVLRFFEGHIGPFPYEKLANVQSTTRYGGMENASNIFYSERSVSGTGRSEGLIAHEVAHQWFGDSVTEGDWHHIWLSEGFATYFTQLYMEFTYGRDRLAEGMRDDRDTVVSFHERRPELAVVDESITELTELLNRNSYQKGGWVLHMLRRQVGDRAFREGIRDYYRTFRDTNALTADLQRVMEEASGQELGWFFQQWIHRPGHPELSGSWSYDEAAGTVTVVVEQTQAGEPFRFPLDVGIWTDALGAPVLGSVEFDEARETATFEVEARPVRVALDPLTWLLMEGELEAR